MRKLKTRAQFQAMMAQMPVAKTQHFVLYRQSVCPVMKPCMEQKASIDDTALPVADFKEALQAFSLCAQQEKSSTDHIWLGCLIPKRWAKNAVTRNLVRRQIAALMLEQHRSILTAAGQAHYQPSAWLVRMRESFHSKKKQKNQNSNSVNTCEITPPIFTSASSETLKKQVRRELLILFSRANKAPSAHHSRMSSV